MSVNQKSGVILAVDYGLTYVGLAACDFRGRVAVGAGRLEGLGARALGRAVCAAARQRNAKKILIGSPPVGAHNVKLVIEGANKLASSLERMGFEILRWDESYTTAAALAFKRHIGGKSKPTKEWIDEAAAIILLQSYLDAHKRESAKV